MEEHNKINSENSNLPEAQNGRRNFLKFGAIAAGLTVIGGSLIKVFADETIEDTHVPDSGEKVTVLCSDGKVYAANPDHLKQYHPVPVITDSDARKGIPGKKFVMVIDLAKCDGCGKCTKACNKMHYLPTNKKWMNVLEMQDSPELAPYYFPKPCFHCDNPPCTKVCPVDATFKREDGIVAIDNERCIGCRFCMAACPYSTRVFNWTEPAMPPIVETAPAAERVFQSKKGCVEKCDFCPHMAREGKLPACVTGCPMNAIWFGDANEDAVTCYDTTTKLSQLLEDGGAYRFMEELGTEPRVYYLPPKNRSYNAKEIKIKNIE